MLAVLALTLAALFCGAALYVAAVEHPARQLLAPRDQLTQWKPAYARGLLLQAPLAALAGAAGFVVWFQWQGMTLFLIGALLMWGVIAYTFAAMWRLNGQLTATASEAADSTLLDRWWRLHIGRTVIGFAGLFAYAIALIDVVRR